MATLRAELRQNYLQRLAEVRSKAGDPPIRDISERANLSPTLVLDILRGRITPPRNRLLDLLSGFSASIDDAHAVLHAFDMMRAAQRREEEEGTAISGQLTPSARPSRRPFVPKRGQPDPIRVANAEQLQQALQAVRLWGGKPSLRKLERRDPLLRRSTMSEMLTGKPKVPDYDRYLAFLTACGIDRESLDVWVYTWRRLMALEKGDVASWMGGTDPVAAT